MEPVKRPSGPRPDPFDDESDFVHAEMDALYDAIYNVRLHHHHGRKQPWKSFVKACDRAVLLLQNMREQKR